MRVISIVLTLFLFGCSTPVPITPNFQEVPAQLLQVCPPLDKINDDDKLSDIAKSITSNYTTYYKCSIKTESWIEWYKKQKSIFESSK
jgi:hypothetical protein